MTSLADSLDSRAKTPDDLSSPGIIRRDSDITILPLESTPLEVSRSRSSTTSGLINFINNGSRTNLALGARKPKKGNLISLFRLLILELNLPQPESLKPYNEADIEEQNHAYDQLVNMVQVPWYLERFVCFGLLVCFNSFLTLFTLVPLKICIISYQALQSFFDTYRRTGARDWSTATKKLHFIKRDSINLLIIVSTVALLSSPVLEISRLYHDIRGQAHLKLYVTFGIIEVIDKLLSSIGQEILLVLNGIPFRTENRVKLATFGVLAVLYSTCHSYMLIYQCVSLNVAANSYSNALMALLLSNQFAELKGAVFKKFEREGLFQVTMSDLTERFQLSVMLFVIGLRNLAQLSSTHLGLIPNSWNAWNNWIGVIIGPAVVVIGSEVFVDWLKHCFISKFNRIRPKVYNNFLYVLSVDFMDVFTDNSKLSTLHEMSDYITLAKRLGLPTLPLCVCFLRVLFRDMKQIFIPKLSFQSIITCLVLFLLTLMILLIVRLTSGLVLLLWAKQIKLSHEARQQELREKSAKVSVSTPLKKTSSGDSQILNDILNDPLAPTDYFSKEPSVESVLSSGAGLEQTHSDASSQYDIDTSFIPGVPNTESSSINPKLRTHLYDHGEDIPPTPEERRNQQMVQKRRKSPTKNDPLHEPLGSVYRYKMASKRIW